MNKQLIVLLKKKKNKIKNVKKKIRLERVLD